MIKLFLAVLIVSGSLLGAAAAQDPAPDEMIAGVEITWPPPVTEVWGAGDVVGTASIDNMAYYYLEYLPLNDDLSFPANSPWIPATIAIEEPVVNGLLATLDTTEIGDGLYALRLVVNTSDGQAFTDIVSPIRVSNERFNEDMTDDPQPTPADDTPTVTIVPGGPAVNVRRCDVVDNDRCPIIGALRRNETATIVGVSSNGSGWFRVRQNDGNTGWVSPSVVAASGDLNSLPRISPPRPLPTPVVIPTAVPIINVIPNALAIVGNRAVCDEPFTAQVNITNFGNTASPAGTVSLQDISVRTGRVTFTGYGAYPAINPGGNYVVSIQVLVDTYYNEPHQLRARTGNQDITLQYTLEKGDCP